MRNSFLPFVLMLLIAAAAIPMAMRGPARGSGGPEINPGVFCPPKKAVYQVTSLDIGAENRVSVVSPEPMTASAIDVRCFIVVAAEDRSPLTAAVMLALAEGITNRGGVAILDPLRGPESETGQVLALGADHVIRVATIAGDAPVATAGMCEATVRLRSAPVRLPASHPGARLQPSSEARASELTIAHRSTGRDGSWPGWYAAFGRGVAEVAFATLAVKDPAGPAALDVPDWGTGLPQPPQADTLRWSAAFQHELVRGWIGRVVGTTTIGRTGANEPSLAQLEKHLAKGGWKRSSESPGNAVDNGASDWMLEKEGTVSLLSVRGDAGGYDVILWQERPHPAELFEQWLDAATDGTEPAADRAVRAALPERQRERSVVPTREQVQQRARRALERHLDADGIPADLRARARALLAAPAPSAAPKPTAEPEPAPTP